MGRDGVWGSQFWSSCGVQIMMLSALVLDSPVEPETVHCAELPVMGSFGAFRLQTGRLLIAEGACVRIQERCGHNQLQKLSLIMSPWAALRESQ